MEACDLLRLLCQPGAITVAIDTRAVVDRFLAMLAGTFRRRRPWQLVPGGDSWQLPEEAMQAKGAHALHAVKVKGHATQDDVRDLRITQEQRVGNHLAVLAATRGHDGFGIDLITCTHMHEKRYQAYRDFGSMRLRGLCAAQDADAQAHVAFVEAHTVSLGLVPAKAKRGAALFTLTLYPGGNADDIITEGDQFHDQWAPGVTPVWQQCLAQLYLFLAGLSMHTRPPSGFTEGMGDDFDVLTSFTTSWLELAIVFEQDSHGCIPVHGVRPCSRRGGTADASTHCSHALDLPPTLRQLTCTFASATRGTLRSAGSELLRSSFAPGRVARRPRLLAFGFDAAVPTIQGRSCSARPNATGLQAN